ncbi:MAG: FHA domain-containing protein [Armatimonadetes bacterium]|nr:FHA domain-containing protein [Armatimonadota bacterium]
MPRRSLWTKGLGSVEGSPNRVLELAENLQGRTREGLKLALRLTSRRACLGEGRRRPSRSPGERERSKRPVPLVRAARLLTGQIRIGSDPSLELCIPGNPQVSGLHAGLLRQGGTWYCFDLQSETGTIVDGERIDNRLHPLSSGAEIRIGDQVFRIVYEAAGVPRPIRTTWRRPAPGSRLEFE